MIDLMEPNTSQSDSGSAPVSQTVELSFDIGFDRHINPLPLGADAKGKVLHLIMLIYDQAKTSTHYYNR